MFSDISGLSPLDPTSNQVLTVTATNASELANLPLMEAIHCDVDKSRLSVCHTGGVNAEYKFDTCTTGETFISHVCTLQHTRPKTILNM